MHHRFLTLLLLALAFFFNSGAQAATTPCKPGETGLAACLGQQCQTIGETTMDKDRKNIIACLMPDSGSTPVWKAMSSTGSNPPGTLCGFATAGYNCNGPYMPNPDKSWYPVIPCEGYNIVVGHHAPSNACEETGGVLTCPNGYQKTAMRVEYSFTQSGGDEAYNTTSESWIGFCAKK